MQNITNIAIKFIQDESKNLNFFDDKGNFDFKKIKEYLLKDQRRAYVLVLIIIYLSIGWGNDLLCNLIGFLYPAYASIKAVESQNKEDDTKWLMYWCVYGLFGLLEFFSDIFLFWIPFYALTKCFFLIWLMVPGSRGGTHLIYFSFIRPLFLTHHAKIDQKIDEAKEIAKKAINETITKNE